MGNFWNIWDKQPEKNESPPFIKRRLSHSHAKTIEKDTERIKGIIDDDCRIRGVETKRPMVLKHSLWIKSSIFDHSLCSLLYWYCVLRDLLMRIFVSSQKMTHIILVCRKKWAQKQQHRLKSTCRTETDAFYSGSLTFLYQVYQFTFVFIALVQNALSVLSASVAVV